MSYINGTEVHCANPDCDSLVSGKSKYCKAHAREARTAWRQMVADKAAERDERNERFRLAVNRAQLDGTKAAEACVPVPMVVVQRANPLDDSSAIVKRYEPIADGACGFAWVTIRPGNSAFAHYAKAHLGASKNYGGGLMLWISAYNQSMAKKEAFARAYAKSLTEAGIPGISWNSRMD
jgi:hypothetical protein